MRIGWKIDWAVSALTLCAFASLASAQAGQMTTKDAPSPAPALTQVPAGDVVREIDDPHNGGRWLLVYDANHPGGPGRLVPVSEPHTDAMHASDSKSANSKSRVDATEFRNAEIKAETPAPIIRAGDPVIVEENSPIIQARLEAVAMGPALAGSFFNVRLTIGGKVVRAVAVEAGRAVLQKESGR